MTFIKLEKKNNWGSYYYAPQGEALDQNGFADTKRGLPLKAGQTVLVRWPSGKVEAVSLVTRTHREEVSDHGHSNTVTSDLFGFMADVDDLTLWVELDQEGLEVDIEGDLRESEYQVPNDTDPTFEVFEAYNTDCEGRRRTDSIGYFSTEAMAKEATKGSVFTGTAGHKAVRVDNKVFVVTGKPIDLDNQVKRYEEDLRQKTLEGLTSEQRRVLGL